MNVSKLSCKRIESLEPIIVEAIVVVSVDLPLFFLKDLRLKSVRH